LSPKLRKELLPGRKSAGNAALITKGKGGTIESLPHSWPGKEEPGHGDLRAIRGTGKAVFITLRTEELGRKK